MKIKKVTEAHIQAVLMQWVMNTKNHQWAVPNTHDFFYWEADLISMTTSNLVHEFEVKLNIYDFKADAKKRKHFWLGHQTPSPSYFWYVTYDFEIEPPEKAGWILVRQVVPSAGTLGWDLKVMKEAPRLNKWNPDARRTKSIARMLSFRLMHSYQRLLIDEGKI